MKLPLLKRTVFSLIPAAILILLGSFLIRAFHLDRPSFGIYALPEENIGFVRDDPALFWTLKPNLNVRFKSGQTVRTNALGLRAAPVKPKAKNEFRILSLGESSTFGAGVSQEETYSAVLERKLNETAEGAKFTVINAGVPAYSSFQSLKYLRTRGLRLKPDLILFYHEANDYLPSTLRDHKSRLIGVTMTDPELERARSQKLRRFLMRYSAIFRAITYAHLNRKIKKLNEENYEKRMREIGLPDIGIPPRLYIPESERDSFGKLDERKMGRRVSEEERGEILAELLELTRKNGIKLILIHPAYKETRKHECLLTRFAKKHRVLIAESYEALHGGEAGVDSFLDLWHPTTEAYARLAGFLADFIRQNIPDASE